LSELRSEYFTSNPDSPYRGDVTRGAVVGGMGRFDVLAAWGHPDSRVLDNVDQEKWTYIDTDSDSGDALEYNLLFRDGVLDRWTTRQFKNTGLAYRGKTEEQTRIVPAEPPAGKRVPTN
jgi:hypothetical protein